MEHRRVDITHQTSNVCAHACARTHTHEMDAIQRHMYTQGPCNLRENHATNFVHLNIKDALGAQPQDSQVSCRQVLLGQRVLARPARGGRAPSRPSRSCRLLRRRCTRSAAIERRDRVLPGADAVIVVVTNYRGPLLVEPFWACRGAKFVRAILYRRVGGQKVCYLSCAREPGGEHLQSDWRAGRGGFWLGILQLEKLRKNLAST